MTNNGSKKVRLEATTCLAVLLSIFLAATTPAQSEMTPMPPYDATSDTVFDIIRSDDPQAPYCFKPTGIDRVLMWDKRIDGEIETPVITFEARYGDGAHVRVLVNAEFTTLAAAQTEAERYLIAIGRLPPRLRLGVKTLKIHKGDHGFHAGTGQFTVYADMADRRVAQNHLEESVLHEAVHAALDDVLRDDAGWREAQRRDGRFVTSYSAAIPDREDLAETALFAYALGWVAGRIPPVDARTIEATVPNRLAFLKPLLRPDTTLPPQAKCGQ